MEMIKFKKFNPEDFETDTAGLLVPTNVLFINHDSVVMLGTLEEHCNYSSGYYILTENKVFPVDDQTLVCKIEVEV